MMHGNILLVCPDGQNLKPKLNAQIIHLPKAKNSYYNTKTTNCRSFDKKYNMF
jgi:hypothetical protein